MSELQVTQVTKIWVNDCHTSINFASRVKFEQTCNKWNWNLNSNFSAIMFTKLLRCFVSVWKLATSKLIFKYLEPFWNDGTSLIHEGGMPDVKAKTRNNVLLFCCC